MHCRNGMLLFLGAALAFAQLPAASTANDDLFAATRKGDVEQVKALLAKGADVNAKNRYGSTPLFFACDRGNLEMVRLLIDKGANLDVKDTFYNMSPISWAVSKKNDPLLKLLIEKGANPEAPLMSAVRSNNKEMFDLVLEKGKPSAELLGEAFYLAESLKREPMVEALKAKGVTSAGVALTEAELNAYTGKFVEQGGDGAVTLSVKDGQLQFSQGTFAAKLLAQGDHRFKFVEQGMSIRFVRSENGFDKALVPSRGGDVTYNRVKEPAK